MSADLASAASATPRSTASTSASAAAAATAASIVSGAGGGGPAPIALDLRPPTLHESALSPAEHAFFPIWLSGIKAAPSGQPGLYDEQDALTFLRRDCGIDIEDEIQILSLFERTPRGMTAGHLYALMRLASWVKAGQTPTRRLLFTQAPPLKLRKQPPQSPPKPAGLKAELANPIRYPTAAPHQTSAALAHYQRSTTAMPSSSPRESSGMQTIVNKPIPSLPPMATASSSIMTPQPSSAAMSPYASRSGQSTVMAPTPALPSSGIAIDAILGFDPAPNPFKQAAGSAHLKHPQQFQAPPPAPPPRPQQPRIVKPTPVVASAAGASNPFRSASMSIPRSAPMYGVSNSGQSDHSGGSGAQGAFANQREYSFSAVAAVAAAAQAANRPEDYTSPPLPPRPSFGGGEAAALGQLIQTTAPPPLPARVHPLIQAGLYASSEVRKRKEALPPKTFSVIQSSSSTSKAQQTKSKSKPRLLTGEAAPKDVLEMLPPPPQHLASAKKRAAAAAAVGAAGGTNTPFSHRGGETRRSVSDVQAFLRRHSEHDSDGNLLGSSDLDRTRSRGATSGVGFSEDGAGPSSALMTGSKHGADSVVPGSTSGAKTTLLGNPATYAPKASYAHVSKAKGSLPAWLREQEELQRSSLLPEDPERPPTTPRSPFSPSAPVHVRSHSSSLHTSGGSNGHLRRRSANASGGSMHQGNRHSMISALDSAVLEDDDEDEGGRDSEDQDDDEEAEGDEDFVDAPVALMDRVSRGGPSGSGALDDSRSEQEMSEKARSAATSIERPHNPFAERSLGKGHPSALMAEPVGGGGTLVRPLGRSKTLHHGKDAPPPPPPAPPRRRLDSSPATALESPQFTLSSGQAFQPPPQRSPTADLRRGGSLRISSTSSNHSRYPTDEGTASRTGSIRDRFVVNPKRANSMSWQHQSGSSSPTEINGGGRAVGSGITSTAMATTGSKNSVGATIKEKMTDLFRQSIGGEGALSRDYVGSNGHGTGENTGGFGPLLTKPSPQGERPIDLLQQDIAAVVERHGWLARAAEKAKGRPVSEGRRGLMSDRNGNDEDEDDGAYVGSERMVQPHRRTKLSDRPQPDDDGVAPDTDTDRPMSGSRRRMSSYGRRTGAEEPLPEDVGVEVGSPDQSPFGDSHRPVEDGYARLS
ncbi:hypothetical protein A4X13_0g819 [Tilletia indica]|uniref:Uncharacterized protein n=1 Tax=Tilletia indica TaxID=43049 RepID=A0A177TRT4_9BASI|nr:hypothetical protein A4X13_0g819 [Tilletia indica]